MKLLRPKEKSLVILLLNRTVVFLLCMTLLAVFLYAIGTVQGFMDATQFFLLRLISVLGFVFGISALYALLLDLFMLAKTRSLHFLGGALAYFLLFGLGGGLSMFSSFILAAAAGS